MNNTEPVFVKQINIETVRYYCGLGDIVMLAWLAEACSKTDTWLVFYRKRNLELLHLLGLNVQSDRPGGIEMDVVFNTEVAEKCKRPRLDYLREFLGLNVTYERPKLHLTAEDEEAAEKRVGQLGAPPILLFPQTAWKAREWPACYWVDLAWSLHRFGLPVLVMLEKEDPRFTNTPNYQWGTPIGQLASLMKRSRLVIGNDSFPAHLAGTVGVPTMALMGPTRPTVFAHMTDVECLASTMNCTGCHFQNPFRAACDQGCLSMHRLFPEAVLERVLQKIQGR